MPEQTPTTKPEIFVTRPDLADAVMSAKRLQLAMYRDPNSFVEALNDGDSTPKVRRAANMIETLFDSEHMQRMYFDDDSEDQIAQNAVHQDLLQERTTVERSKTEELRREITKNRYAIFAGRVATWQSMTSGRPSVEATSSTPRTPLPRAV